MGRTVISTKVHAPGVRADSVARPRLADALDHSRHARIVLFSAPAGFGKTTLLSQWLSTATPADDVVAWFSLDQADSDPETFWFGIVAALSAADAAGSLGLDLGSIESATAEAVVPSLVNAVSETSRTLWLVLDDYHVIESTEINEGVTAFIEHAPANLHTVVSTRVDPNMPLPRWRARGELVELRSADLRFTLDETNEYLTASGLELAPQDVARLEDRTEGWAAALQLAALSLRGREDASGFIARFAGDDRYVVDYLADEVLRGQSSEVRTFLLQTSVLERLTGPLCDAVTLSAGGAAMLASLERANMFVIPLDDRREWFRYHHLFADVLRSHLLAEIPDRVSELHVRASEWFDEHGLVDEAITHALAARAFPRAARLVEEAIPAIRQERREAVLVTWLGALPEDVVRASPVLTVFAGHLCLARGNVAGAQERFDAADDLLSSRGPAAPEPQTEELRTLPATIAAYRAAIAQATGDLPLMRQHAQRVLDLAGPGDHLARGSGAGFLALAAWSEGDIDDALTSFTLAIESLSAAGNLVDELVSTVALADMWIVAGRPTAAARLYSAAIARAHTPGTWRAATALHIGASQMAVGAADLHAARHHLEQAAELADAAGIGESAARLHVARADLAAAEGEFAVALAELDDAGDLHRPEFLPDVRPIDAIAARVLIRSGDLQAARERADKAARRRDRSPYLREYDVLTIARLEIAEHQSTGDSAALRRAAEIVDQLSAAAREQNRLGSALEIGILSSAVRVLESDIGGAVDVLGKAIDAVDDPLSYASSIAEFGSLLSPVLETWAGRSRHPDAVRSMLARLSVTPRARPIATAEGVGQGSLSDRELDVLRMLDTDLTGPEIARALYISHNTMRTHTKHIYEKLGVTSRRAAVSTARERGLI